MKFTPTGAGESYSLQVQELWPGGSLGISLTGNGETIYQWEAATSSGSFPDTANAQLKNQIILGNTFTGISNHATLMAQIMVGVTGDSTQGVAYQSQIKAYSLSDFWLNMRTAANAGMVLSNHAYGFNAGANVSGTFWNGLEEIDSTQDYNFGLYGTWDQHFDSLLYANPYYLSVQSAGNGRGEEINPSHSLSRSVNGSSTNYELVTSTHPRGINGGTLGYDCIASGATYKNGILVGAAQILPNGYVDSSSVTAQPGSAFGPTDDGRIKPDVVAGGDKTSQATSAVTGLLALLKQQYQNIYGKQPLASTLKGVLLHTADEAGNFKGPDYQYGWGLVNAVSAANQFSNTDFVHPHFEDTLISGDTALYYFYLDSLNFKATLCYTDAPGQSIPFTLNPSMLNNSTPMLVNDLDMRLINISKNTSYLPYTLFKSNPTTAAQKADNQVDNVEQIDEENPESGWYKLKVSHKGILSGGSQIYSLFVDGARAALFYENGQWIPFAPSGSTGSYDAYIAPNTTLLLSRGFSLSRLYIAKGARVTIQ